MADDAACPCEEFEPGYIEFPPVISGDSFFGFEITFAEPDGNGGYSQVNLDECRVIIYLADRDNPDLTLTIGSGVTLLSAAPPWKVGIDDIETVSLGSGNYTVEIKPIDVNGFGETYLKGRWIIN